MFQQAWFLDAIAGPEYWDVVLVEKKGEIQGFLPLVNQKKWGLFSFQKMPPLTPFLGPWIKPSPSPKPSTALQHEIQILKELCFSIPSCDYFNQRFSTQIKNTLPFIGEGYENVVRYTYKINQLDDLEKVYQEMRSNCKQAIKKAEKEFTLELDNDLSPFLDLHFKTLKEGGLNNLPYNASFVHTYDKAMATHANRQIFTAKNDQGQVVASIYVVWDEHSAYYMMGAKNSEIKQNGATNFLLWEAIKFCSTRTASFDFEGSVIPSIAEFFRSFGGELTPYIQVKKVKSPVLKSMFFLQELF